MNPVFTRKAIACTSVIFGVGWVVYAWVSLYQELVPKGSYVALFVGAPAMCVPGVFFIYYGIKFFQEMKEDHLRWMFGILAVLVGLVISAYLPDWLFGPETGESGWKFDSWTRRLFELTVAVAISWTYLFSMSRILPLVGGLRRSPWDFLNLGTLGFVALEFWMLLGSILRAYAAGSALESSLLGLLPAAIAYVFYKTVIKLLTKDERGRHPSFQPQPRAVALPRSPVANFANWILGLAILPVMLAIFIYAYPDYSDLLPTLSFITPVEEAVTEQPRLAAYLLVALFGLTVLTCLVGSFISNFRFRKELMAERRRKELTAEGFPPSIPSHGEASGTGLS